MPGAEGESVRRLVARSAVAALWASLAGALAPVPALAQRYFVHTYSENDGLPSSTTNAVAQDAEGLMWFATRAGIARYDGFEWTSFSTADGLTTPDQFGLAVDSAGTLWAASSARPFSVASFAEGRFVPLPEAPPSVQVGERTSGFAITRHEGRTLAALTTTERRLHVWEGSRWRTLAPDPGVELGPAAPVVGCGGRFFVATERGLGSTDARAAAVSVQVFDGMPSPRVVGVAVASPDDGACPLWLAGADWLGRLEGGRFTLVTDGIPGEFSEGYESLVLTPDRRGGVFLGNPLGLRWVDDSGSVEELTPRSGLIATGATSILVDRESNVWIGSLRGVSKIASFRFGTLDQSHGLLENEVTAVLERRRGGFVLGHARGLTLLDAGAARTLVLAGPDVPASTTRMLDLSEDARGRIWVAAGGVGLARVDPEGRVQWYRLAGPPEVIHSVRVTRDGAVWALATGGLYRVESGRFVPVPGGPKERSRRLFEGSGDTLYVATGADGVHVRRADRWSHWDVGEGEANNVFAVLEEHHDEAWIGTAAGLFVRRAGRIERALLGGRPVERRVYFLVRDRRGRLWIGTDNGVLRWNPERQRLRHFTVLDGLAGRETNRAAGAVDSRGRVWIGTERGVSVYDGTRERSETPVPRVVLRYLEADGRRHPLDHPVDLAGGRGELRFDFRAPSFLDESRLRYRSRLEGYEDTWTAPFGSPSIRYTNLSPGEYHFHLQAANPGGEWSAPASSARIVIPRPFLGSPLFFALVAAAAGWGLYLVQGYAAQKRYARRLEDDVRARTADLSRVNADLRSEAAERERAEAERERLIGELETRNSELESFTYTVSHDLKSPLVTIEGFLGWVGKDVARGDTSRVEHDLALVRSGVQKMEALLDELLQLSRVGRVANRPEEVDLGALVADAVSMVAGEIAERGVEVEVAPGLPRVFADRLRLLQVFQNLLKNAVRFAGEEREPRIRIEAKGDAAQVVCRVSDNGIGIEPEYHERVFRLFERLDPGRGGTGVGLAIAERIVKAHGGRIWIESEGAGRGTTVCFSIPRLAGAPA